ncbi:tail fiber protein [Hafnia phage vB_HpaA_yong1]|uniref:Tail fiber protein n=1 Tax=Hafnia phage vB_HpaA_yong1 TaxID=2562199 RepID=A0A482MHK0_9CAUD|nr:tail fiber protein [Hafnia phage vB_HpaA_yong1]
MSTITQFPSGNTQYRIEFDYLARTFVVVTLVNSSNPTLNRVLEVGRDYRFLNPTMIEMLVDQSGFDIVRIHRQTGTDLVVDFRNGSVLTASDLTNAELQAIHIAEEGRDQTVDLAKEYADAAGSSAGSAKDSEDEARRIAAIVKEGLLGYITRRSFEKGFNVTTWSEVLLWEEDGEYYRWDGDLPKTVPVGSTPASTGGVGLGAWVSVGDATVLPWIKEKTGLSDTIDELELNLSSVGTASIQGVHEVPSGGLSLPVGTTLTGYGQRLVQFSGDLSTMLGRGCFTKSNNTPVTITSPNNPAQTVATDAIAYVNTDSLGTIGTNEIFGSSVVIRDAAFKGTSPTQNEVGIEVLTGGGFIFENVQVFNTKFGVRLGDVYLSNLIRCHFSGAVQQMSGTSTHYDNVWARGHTDVLGAFHFENLNYSVLDSCCSDRPRRGAFYFNNCVNLTLNSCATEGPGYFQNLGATEGGAVIFDTGNRITLNNFQISPLGPNTSIDGTSYTGPLITVGNDNNIIIERLFTNNAAAYTNADLYVHGNGSFVEIKAAQVRRAKNMPIIHIEPGSTSVVVVHLNGGNRAILKAGATKESPVVEYEYQREAFNPMLLIGGSSIGITYSARSGTWSKNGNTVTVNFTLTLSSKGALTGNVTIGNLPKNVPALTGGILTSWSDMANGPFVLGSVLAGDNSIPLRRVASTATIIATNTELTDTSSITGSITYQIADSMFNAIPS